MVDHVCEGNQHLDFLLCFGVSASKQSAGDYEHVLKEHLVGEFLECRSVLEYDGVVRSKGSHLVFYPIFNLSLP